MIRPMFVLTLMLSAVNAAAQINEFQRIQILSGDYSGLPAQDAPDGPEFGYSVAMDGDWLAVGAPGTVAESSMGIVGEEGAVFLFNRQGNGWQLHETIIDSGRHCGHAVALRFPHLAFGCPSTSGNSHVHFYTYAPSESSWERTGGFSTGAECGVSIAMTGVHRADGTAMAAIGCPDNSSFQSVNIWKFDPNDTSISPLGWWDSVKSLSPSDGVAGDRFGESVALYRACVLNNCTQRVAVGAPNKTHGSAQDAGSVYLFGGSGWPQTNILTYTGTPEDFGQTFFGAALAMSGTELMIGVPGGRTVNYPNAPGAGHVHHWRLSGGSWQFIAPGTAVNAGGSPSGQQSDMRFGGAVAIGPGGFVAVAAPLADGKGATIPATSAQDTGVVELRRGSSGYNISNGAYRGEIRPDPVLIGYEEGRFGTSLDFSGSVLAVGYPYVPTSPPLLGGGPRGLVWIYDIGRVFVDRFEQ